MSLTYSLVKSKQTIDVLIAKRERYHPYDQSRRHNRNRRGVTNFQHNSDSSSDECHSNTHRSRKKLANKKSRQVAKACDRSMADTKEPGVLKAIVDEKYIGFTSSESDMDVDSVIRNGSMYCNSSINKEETRFGTVTVTEQKQDHRENNGILQECCEKNPEIDAKMINDFSKAFDNPSKDELSQIALYIQNLPYEKDAKNPPINQAIELFNAKRKLDMGKLGCHLKDVREDILGRCSYGFLIINKDKDHFLAVRNCHGKHKWSAPKGHQKMKDNGEWEIPFETAFREINEEVHYWDPRLQQWCTFDKHLLKNFVTYLELVFESKIPNYRRIGLFVVCLQNDFQFNIKDRKELDKVNWFKFQDKINSSDFYTLYPFVEYVRNHPELLSNCEVDWWEQFSVQAS